MTNFELPNRRRIYLMRHGEAAYVADDGTVTNDPVNVPLTSRGREQAATQGQTLANIEFDRAICSGLPRTVETAELVLRQNNQAADLPLTTKPEMQEIHPRPGGFRELPSDDAAAAKLLEEVANPWAIGAQPGARFLGGERFDEFGQRVLRGWQQIVSDPSWDTLLLVLHGAVNRCLLNHIAGLDWQAAFCIEQDNCCINVIDVDGVPPSRYLLRGVNITAYNLAKDGIVLTNMEDSAARLAASID